MTETPLIDALDGLRETYAQRLKSTNTLLNTLKSAASALAKTTRVFKDYTEQNASADLSKVENAQQALTTVRLKEEVSDPLLPDLRRESKLLGEFITALRNVQAALRDETIDVVKLGKAYTALQKSKVQDQALEALMPEITAQLEEAQRSLAATFGAALRDALEEAGIELGGRPPVFEIGRFEVRTDFTARTATISYGKEIVARRVPLSVEGLIKAYQREYKTILGRNEDSTQWIRQLSEAWEIARRKRENADLRANIVECYYELVLLRQGRTFRSAPSKRAFADYSRAQFAYDLDQFVNRQRLDYKGQRAFVHVAIKANTDSAERSLWVVDGSGPHDGRYMGDIVFQKE